MSDVEWHSVALAPIVLVHGTETLIADRAVQRLRGLAREADPHGGGPTTSPGSRRARSAGPGGQPLTVRRAALRGGA